MFDPQETLPMRRRRLLLAVGMVVLLGVAGFGLHWLTRPTPGITWDNFRRLRKGLSAKDVEALLGEPHRTRLRIGEAKNWVSFSCLTQTGWSTAKPGRFLQILA
jgi:hypothetical protein